MPERYKHPPLAELVAELRWGSGNIMPTAQQSPVLLVAAGQYEEFFMRFGSKVGAHGYERVERIVPPGFPTMPFQAIYRFRQKQQTKGTTLYQVGPGMFSVNITPPYHSWREFRPVVAKGVSVLLEPETRNASEANQPFSNAILRYINSFDDRFTQGHSIPTFVRDVLGFKIELPSAVLNELAPDKEVKPYLQLAIPLRSGQQMSMLLAEGTVSGAQTVIMDITVSLEAPIPPTEVDVMAVFDAAHDVIHRVFVGTTTNLSSIMEPIEGEVT
jgi:uncharacterized protein (TIGR04255 family)